MTGSRVKLEKFNEKVEDALRKVWKLKDECTGNTPEVRTLFETAEPIRNLNLKFKSVPIDSEKLCQLSERRRKLTQRRSTSY